jgi:radical SAM superfamily enzyme YgiQ (UPF0313 family)
MAAEDLPVIWKCCSRADTLDEEIIQQMAAGKCGGVILGIETGSQRMQKSIKKNLNLEVVFPVIDLLKKYNQEVRLSFLYGFPGETLADIEQTLTMIRQSVKKNADHISLQECVIFPGTELHREYARDLVLKEYCTYFIADPSPPEKELVKQHPDIFSYYYRPRNKLLEELTYLDVFISNFFMIPYPYIRGTLDGILDYFTNDLLSLFKDFIRHNPDFPALIMQGRSVPYPENEPYPLFMSIFELYDQYLLRSNFENRRPGIGAIFNKETELFRFLHG